MKNTCPKIWFFNKFFIYLQQKELIIVKFKTEIWKQKRFIYQCRSST